MSYLTEIINIDSIIKYYEICTRKEIEKYLNIKYSKNNVFVYNIHLSMWTYRRPIESVNHKVITEVNRIEKIDDEYFGILRFGKEYKVVKIPDFESYLEQLKVRVINGAKTDLCLSLERLSMEERRLELSTNTGTGSRIENNVILRVFYNPAKIDILKMMNLKIGDVYYGEYPIRIVKKHG